MIFPENALAAAAFLFEGLNGHSLGSFEKSEIDKCDLAATDPEKISGAIRMAIEQDHKSSSTYRQTAYWALGKLHDPGLLPFFEKQLHLELQRDLLAVYQIMIALDNLDEPVFSDERPGSTAHEYDRNREDARRWLENRRSLS